jgi:hypothetical protein
MIPKESMFQLNRHEIENVVSQALTAKGSPALNSQEFLACLDAMYSHGHYVQSIEAYEVKQRGINHPLRLDLSSLGLEGEEKWTYDETKYHSRAFVEQKITVAIQQGLDMEFMVWLAKLNA